MHFSVRRRFSITPFLLLIVPAAFLLLGNGTADLKLDETGASDEEVFSLTEVVTLPIVSSHALAKC